MIIPNIWGQGQLFAFSALDGQTSRVADFCGTLCGDRIGILFHTKIRRALAIVGFEAEEVTFRAVCGDWILADTSAGFLRILFHKAHLVIGEVPEGGLAAVFTEGKHTAKEFGRAIVQDTEDGEYTALCSEGRRFAFAYGQSLEAAAQLAESGLQMDLNAAEDRKLSFYRMHGIEGKYEQLYAKCLSVMRTQLFSPEEKFTGIWSTPDRLPHRDLFLWDSAFHSVGFRNMDGSVAESVLLAVFAYQLENGMISCRVKLTENGVVQSEESQPPILAWGAWRVYEKTKNKAFLKEFFGKNKAFLQWCQKNRQYRENLYAWYIDEDYLICRCGESGMDNSPRFDDTKHLLAIDFSCFMANEMRYMAKIAREIGEEAESFEADFGKIKEAINTVLWDAETGMYFDYDADRERIHRVKSVASFLPLFAGVCDNEKAELLAAHLKNPMEFNTEVPVPSIAKEDATYGSDMWRGPVWLNFNYMICEGLRTYGEDALADAIAEKMLSVVEEWYEKTGVVFEFYDPENKKAPSRLRRKGDPIEPYDMRVRVQAIRDLGWSCCLTLDMIVATNKK